MKKLFGHLMLFIAVVLGFSALTGVAMAQTDITGTLTSCNAYWTTAETLGIGILLFVLGRRVVKKI